MIKDEVLEILERNRGKEVSGEQIALSLNVSRAYICKAVKALRGEGNDILSKSNGGYTLTEHSPALSSVGIGARMKRKVSIIYFDEIDSTNKQAKILASSGAQNATVVAADYQTDGKGRRGRDFYSPEGSGVYFSLIVRPDRSYGECQKSVFIAAVAVSRAIEKVCGIATQIKWVNDIYYKGKKVAGISTESLGELGAECPDALIVGIGINVSTTGFPQELVSKAGSLGVSINRNALIAACVDEFFDVWEEKNDDFLEKYREKCFIIGKSVEVLPTGKEPYAATAIKIEDDGALVVEKSNGERVKLITEEVSLKII